MYKKNVFVLILFIYSLDASFAQTAHGYARQGDKKFIAKDFKKAEESYLKAIAIDENYAYPWNNLGNIYLNNGKYDEAK